MLAHTAGIATPLEDCNTTSTAFCKLLQILQPVRVDMCSGNGIWKSGIVEDCDESIFSEHYHTLYLVDHIMMENLFISPISYAQHECKKHMGECGT